MATKALNVYSAWTGVEHGAGAGDPPAAHGQGGHLPPHLLLSPGILLLFPLSGFVPELVFIDPPCETGF